MLHINLYFKNNMHIDNNGITDVSCASLITF